MDTVPSAGPSRCTRGAQNVAPIEPTRPGCSTWIEPEAPIVTGPQGQLRERPALDSRSPPVALVRWRHADAKPLDRAEA